MDENSEYSEKYLFSQKEIAELFKITSQAIWKWELNHVQQRGSEKLYYLPDVIAYWEKIHHDQSKLDLEQERARLAIEQTAKTKLDAQKARLDIAERKKTLVDIQEIEKAWAKIVTVIKSHILGLPDKLVLALELQNDIPKRQLVKEIVLETMQEISSGEPQKEFISSDQSLS